MKNSKKKEGRISLRQRFRYWLDRRMAQGTSSMVKLLVLTVLGSVLLVTVLVMAFGLHKEGKSFLAVLWDNLRSAMSSSFPSSESGTLLYIVLYTFLGLIGMVFTGMLIGIFSSSIRGRLLALQKENSPVLEKGHTVILGFRPGEYALLEQMVLAAGKEKRTLVIADQIERVDMEQAVRENVKVPKNVRLIFRKAEITSPAALACCHIPECSTIVIHAHERGTAVKTLLAVASLLKDSDNKPHITATVDSDEAILPPDTMRDMDLHMLHSGDMVGRIIARAATQPGVFQAFMEIISFHGYEFYFEAIPKTAGMKFGEVLLSCEGGIVAGLYRNGAAKLDPDPETEIREDDLFIVFEEEEGNVRLSKKEVRAIPEQVGQPEPAPIPELVIFGANNALPMIIGELPDNIENIRIAGVPKNVFDSFLAEDDSFASQISGDFRNTASDWILMDMVKNAAHLILLSDRKKQPEEADTETLLLLMRLRDIKRHTNLPFTITAEMRCENNRKLVDDKYEEDFVVATDLSSMILAQISEDTRRASLFDDLMDEEGSEVYLKKLSELGIEPGKTTAGELRTALYAMSHILVGLQTKDQFFRVLSGNEELTLTENDRLILIGEA